jgi:hypothetical protein
LNKQNLFFKLALSGWKIFNGKAIICYRTISNMASMKKDFIVARIVAAQDGGPYVYVGFCDPND